MKQNCPDDFDKKNKAAAIDYIRSKGGIVLINPSRQELRSAIRTVLSRLEEADKLKASDERPA